MINDSILRPQTFNDYIGQEDTKENLKVYIESAKKREKPLAHVILHGSAGLGKTTLATVIANEYGSKIMYANAANIEKIGDLVSYFVSLDDNDFLFIDEIHRLDKKIEENLYTAMEDFRIDIQTKRGNDIKPISVNLSKFTLIGATTMKGKLSTPLIDRFGINIHLKEYKDSELQSIIDNNAKKIGLSLDSCSLSEISKRSRKTPRRANTILDRLYDFAIVSDIKDIDIDFTKNVLNKLKIDEFGLEDIDRKILIKMYENSYDKPIGINALASTTGESRETIENDIEPYLLQNGYIERTARGRKITEKAINLIINNDQ